MYQKILVPLDGSALAADVLPHVQEIVRCAGAQVVLLRVTPPPRHIHDDADVVEPRWTGAAPRTLNSLSWDLMADPIQRDEWIEHEVEVAQHYLDSVEAQLTKAGMRVRTLVRPGAAAEAILGAADAEGIDLIAMSTHGWTGLDRFLLGSVADRVAHYAKVPLLLVRAEDHGEAHLEKPGLSYKRILVPLDGSPLADEVLPQARELARCANAEVLLLQVVPELTDWPTAEAAFIFSGGMAREGHYASEQREPDATLRSRKAEYLRETAQTNLDAAAAQLKLAGLKVETLIQDGHPAEVILEVAQSCHADVIAMTTHGRSGLRRFLMGSVASRVLEYASVPLLLVRHQPSHQSDHLVGA